MRDLFKISFSVEVQADRLIGKRVADPLVKALEKAVPLLERAGEAIVKEMEHDVNYPVGEEGNDAND